MHLYSCCRKHNPGKKENSALDQEISKAEICGKSVFVALDANSKLGPEFIPNDLHKMSNNGEILAEIVEKNAMIVVNDLDSKCDGVIT